MLVLLLGGCALQASPAPMTWASSTLLKVDRLSGMTTDKAGNVYVIQDGKILKYLVQDDPPSPLILVDRAINAGINEGIYAGNLAVDGEGNLYFTDRNQGQILWIPANSNPGTPPILLYNAGAQRNFGNLAVSRDGSRVFFTDRDRAQLLSILSSLGSLQAPSVLPCPPTPIKGLAVDSHDNIFIADPFTQAIWVMRPDRDTYKLPDLVAQFLPDLRDITLDAGDVIHAIDGDRVLRIPWDSNVWDASTYVPSQMTGALENPLFLGVDGKGVLRVAEQTANANGSYQLLKLSSRFKDTPKASSSGEVMRVSFTFDADTDLSSVDVLMKGAPNKAFLDAGSGSITRALRAAAESGKLPVTFHATDTGTVDVTFAPATPGEKRGAVVLRDSSGAAARTAYLQGNATGPQMVFLPTSTPIRTAPGALTYPWHQDVDGEGRLYVTDQKTGGIKRWDPIKDPEGTSLTPVVDSAEGLKAMGLAVDGAGNVFWGRSGNNVGIVVDEPTSDSSAFTEKALLDNTHAFCVASDGRGNVYYVNDLRDTCTRLTRNPDGTLTPVQVCKAPKTSDRYPILAIAVDGEGNLFLSSGDVSQGSLWKVGYSPAGDFYTEPVQVGNNLPGLYDFVIAPSGAILGTNYSGPPKSIYQISPDKSSTQLPVRDIHQLPVTDIQATIGAALSDDGSLFLADMAGGQCLKYEAVKGDLLFPSTPVQATSERTSLRIINHGTDAFTFGSPEIQGPFAIEPLPPRMDPGEILDLGLTFQPTWVPNTPQGMTEGTLVLKDDAGTPTASASLRGSAQQAQPVIEWTPPTFAFNMPIRPEELTATATCKDVLVQGTFLWTLAAGTVLSDGTKLDADTPLNPGVHALDVGTWRFLVDFKPDDTRSYVDASQTTFWVNVGKAVPGFTFDNLKTPYSDSPQAPTVTTDPPGLSVDLKYTNALGSTTDSVTEGGTYTVQATVSTPHYQGSATRTFTITPATPLIDWTPITKAYYGTPLGNISPNAASKAPGSFSFQGEGSSILEPGSHALTAIFTPSNPANFTTATGPATLQVDPAPTAITWNLPKSLDYGEPLSSKLLNATANIHGTFSYTPSAGATLEIGKRSLAVTFTPEDQVHYAPTTLQRILVVQKAHPTLTWNPAPMAYGDVLSEAQLNARATLGSTGAKLAGTFTYDAPKGSSLDLGSHTLQVTFTPDDTTHYESASAQVTLTVDPRPADVTWDAPAAIIHGTPLGDQQLNAKAGIPGTFSYNPTAGSILNAGTATLSATFTPDDRVHYAPKTVTTPLVVQKVKPNVSWADPSPLTYGKPLGDAQLNATASVPGTFTYSPAPGTLLTAGAHTLQATFTPADPVNQQSATAQVTLQVDPATPTLTWATPAPLTYGQPLGDAQLNATASVPGAFTYTPASGTILPAGSYALLATFTPADPANQRGGSTAQVPLQVLKAPATITLEGLNQPFTGTPRAVTFTTQPAGLPVTVTYDGAASVPSAPGTYAVVATVSDPNHQGSASGTLTIAPAAPTGTLTLQATGNTHAGDPMILTASFSNPGAYPGAPVTFRDGATLLGQAPLVNGEATFKALDLPAGVHAFHATLETGNAGVIQDSGEVSTSILPAVLTLALESQALTVNPGETVHTGFTLAALGRATGPVHLSASGLPVGLTLTFSANDLDPAKLPATLTVDIQAASTLALTGAGRLASLDLGNLGTGLLAMGLLAAPFAGWRRRKRILPWLGGSALVLAAGLTGCHHHGALSPQDAPAPVPPAPPTTCTVLITAHADGMDDVTLPLVLTVEHGSSN